MPTTSYGYELTIGDHTDRNDTPLCCNEDMTSKDNDRGYREFTCHTCPTTLTISPSGLVFDITETREPAPTKNECGNCGAPGGAPYCSTACRDADQDPADPCQEADLLPAIHPAP